MQYIPLNLLFFSEKIRIPLFGARKCKRRFSMEFNSENCIQVDRKKEEIFLDRAKNKLIII